MRLAPVGFGRGVRSYVTVYSSQRPRSARLGGPFQRLSPHRSRLGFMQRVCFPTTHTLLLAYLLLVHVATTAALLGPSAGGAGRSVGRRSVLAAGVGAVAAGAPDAAQATIGEDS
eukprot:365436-Prymnesium_polylepis.1